MNRQSQPSVNSSSLQTVWQIGSCLFTMLGSLTSPVLAQSISIDSSTPTLLNGTSNCSGDCIITGGLRDASGSGPNLFHSFNTFNVDNGSTVTFTDPGVDNIFSRITGTNPSTIDGTLAVNGSANLFLLNANGIMFSESANLDIQGSFLASTADSVNFRNGTQFGNNVSESPSLLTINVPMGLQFGTSPSPIQIQGSGHNLTYNNSDGTVLRNVPTTGLSASSGTTLAFLGGDVSLHGGNLTSEAGHIEVSGLSDNALVKLSPSLSGWDFDYTETSNFSDIYLSNQASLDVSGSNAGSIQIQGKQINASESSAIFAQTTSNGGGQISLTASERISFDGTASLPLNQIPTSAYVEIAPGAIGDGSSKITVATPELNLTAGAQIGLSTAGGGTSGSVDVNTQAINADNGSENTFSGLFTAVLTVFSPPFGFPPGAIGQGGDLNITTEQLTVTNGAQIVASTFGAGDAGNLTIEAKNVDVRGFNTGGASSIRSTSEVPVLAPPNFPPLLVNGSGNGGDLTIRTERLVVTNGGQIAVSTISTNSAGDISISASDAIEITGQVEQGRSGLFASSLIGTGSGGNIQVETPQLSLLEGATINASNFASFTPGPPPGTGSAGNINIEATDIVLKDGSVITTDTASGDRANITLQSDSLVLRRGSNITTNATGSAKGGNINIDTDALIAFENSDITANALDNFGGRVVINAQTILGTDYRNQVTDESDITASSALGPSFSGTVELTTPEIDPTEGITDLPEGLNTENQIVAACDQIHSNTFVATGRGGLPEDASHLMVGQSIWNDFRLLEETDSFPQPKSETLIPDNARAKDANILASAPAIVEAQTWSRDSRGQVILVAYSNTHTSPQMLARCLSK